VGKGSGDRFSALGVTLLPGHTQFEILASANSNLINDSLKLVLSASPYKSKSVPGEIW